MFCNPPLSPHFDHELLMCACINTSRTQSSSQPAAAAAAHRLVARRPAALPAQVQPPPDWTLMASLRAWGPAPFPQLQGAGRRQCRQTAEVRGRAVLTCRGGTGETERERWFVLRDWCISPPLTRRRKTRYAATADLFLERRSRALESADIYDISCVVYLIYTSVPA